MGNSDEMNDQPSLELTLGLGESSVRPVNDSIGSTRGSFTKIKRNHLQRVFDENQNIDPEHTKELAAKLDLTPEQVKIWFRNRRHKNKLKKIEMDGTVWKKKCEDLMVQNSQLHKRIEQLEGFIRSGGCHRQLN